MLLTWKLKVFAHQVCVIILSHKNRYTQKTSTLSLIILLVVKTQRRLSSLALSLYSHFLPRFPPLEEPPKAVASLCPRLAFGPAATWRDWAVLSLSLCAVFILYFILFLLLTRLTRLIFSWKNSPHLNLGCSTLNVSIRPQQQMAPNIGKVNVAILHVTIRPTETWRDTAIVLKKVTQK